MKRIVCVLLTVLLFFGSVMLGVTYHQKAAFNSAEFAAELKALDGVAEHRLMVKSDRKLDLHGAVQTAESGGLYVLQYDSKETAQKAYDDYRALKCVQYV